MHKIVAFIIVIALLSGCITTPEIGQPGVVNVIKKNGKSITVEYCLVPFPENGETLYLEALLYRDGNKETLPGIVMTHGRNGPQPSRNVKEVFGYYQLNYALAEKGCAVLFVVRRGYGRSQGKDSEFLDTPAKCGLSAALDLKAGVEYLQGIDGIEKNNITIIGHSQGGWAAIGASCLSIEGVVKTINLCGGTNYKSMGTGFITDRVQTDWIVGSGELGKHSKIPMVWIYSENDKNHPPDKVKAAFEEFRRYGGTGELHILPPYGDNGHLIVREPGLFLSLIL